MSLAIPLDISWGNAEKKMVLSPCQTWFLIWALRCGPCKAFISWTGSIKGAISVVKGVILRAHNDSPTTVSQLAPTAPLQHRNVQTCFHYFPLLTPPAWWYSLEASRSTWLQWQLDMMHDAFVAKNAPLIMQWSSICNIGNSGKKCNI